jgi:hypothetical protein
VLHGENPRPVSNCYRAYGLTFRCDTRVSAFAQESTDLQRYDFFVSLGPEQDWVRAARGLPPHLEHPRPGEVGRDSSPFTLTSFGTGQFFELDYGDQTVFFVDGAAEHVWGTCLPPLTMEDLAVYLRGPVMGFVLRRRGVMALHASAVAVEGRAVVLCGPSESGKSTTAAALALRGVPVLSDDITALSDRSAGFQVEPGYPRICLWPDAVRDLLGQPDALPRLTPSWEKCFLPLDGNNARFEAQRKPLGAVYLLAPRMAEANAPRIEEMGPREALLDLVQNTYMNWLLNRNQRAAEFDALSKLVTQVPVRRIVPHADPGRIGELCDLILADAKGLSSDYESTSLISKR